MTVWNSKVATLMCPSDGYVGQVNLSNYMACYGTTTVNCCNTLGATPTGIYGYQYGASIAGILDGTSNTIAFSESLSGSLVRRSAALSAAIRQETPVFVTRAISKT